MPTDKDELIEYLKKINEGKHHFVAIGHIDKKLVRVIFSLLKNKRLFCQTIESTFLYRHLLNL